MPTLPLTIHLFGPLRVLIHGEPMPRVRTRTIEWLLALLVLRQGRSVERSWLAGTLWPDSDDERAAHNLRDALVHLRKALGSEKERIQAPTRDTLRFAIEGAEVDLATFDRAIHTGEPEALRRAVEAYTGPLLEGYFEEWATIERNRCEQACLNALIILADIAENGKDFANALALLRRAESMDALRDTTQRGLIRVLAASGDTPAALHTYREYRTRLRQQMNIEPDSETVQLYQQIRRLTRQVAEGKEALPNASRPLAYSVPATQSLRATLPNPLTSLIGREQAIRDIVESFSRSRLVTLVGGGGVGKTRLAIEVARNIASEAKSEAKREVAFVELAALTDTSLLPNMVGTALGIREEANPDSQIRTLTNWLSERDVLLVLDNCEHLINATATLTQALLIQCPELRVLATSRQRLGLMGEVAWRVPSLLVPDPEQIPINPPDALMFPAIKLFVERAASADNEFQLTCREDVEIVCRICRRLDGIPLAIELAAARVRTLTLEDINGKLNQRFQLLTGGSRAALPRQQTLRSLIDWSYDLLSDAEKALLARLSVFAGGWTLEAAESICTGETVEDWEILDLLASLVDKSLVVSEATDDSVRYRLLETIRQYSRDILASRSDGEEVRQRHQHFYLALAEEAEPLLTGPEQARWLDHLEREHDNLRAAMETEDKEAGLRIAGALWRFWFVRGHLSEGRGRLNEALRQAGKGAGNTAARAKALQASGVLATYQGDYTSAHSLLEECLAIHRESGDKEAIASLLDNLGILAYRQGDCASARPLHEESLMLRREIGDKLRLVNVLNNLGVVIKDQGDYESARRLYEEGLAIHRESGNKGGMASLLGNLAILAYAQSDYASARSLHEESLMLRREIGHKLGIANSLGAFAALAITQKQAEWAVQLWGATERLREEIGETTQDEYESFVMTARHTLNEETFNAALAAGRNMPLEQVIALVLSEDSV